MVKPHQREEWSLGTQNPLGRGKPSTWASRPDGRAAAPATDRQGPEAWAADWGRRARAPTSRPQPAAAGHRRATLRRPGPNGASAGSAPGCWRPLTLSAAEPAAADARTGRSGTEGDRKWRRGPEPVTNRMLGFETERRWRLHCCFLGFSSGSIPRWPLPGISSPRGGSQAFPWLWPPCKLLRPQDGCRASPVLRMRPLVGSEWAGALGYDVSGIVSPELGVGSRRCTGFSRCAELFVGLGTRTHVALSCSKWGLKGDFWGLKTRDPFLAPGVTNPRNFRRLQFYPFYAIQGGSWGSSGKGTGKPKWLRTKEANLNMRAAVEMTIVLYWIVSSPGHSRLHSIFSPMQGKPVTNRGKRIPDFNGNSEQSLSGPYNELPNCITCY